MRNAKNDGPDTETIFTPAGANLTTDDPLLPLLLLLDALEEAVRTEDERDLYHGLLQEAAGLLRRRGKAFTLTRPERDWLGRVESVLGNSGVDGTD